MGSSKKVMEEDGWHKVGRRKRYEPAAMVSSEKAWRSRKRRSFSATRSDEKPVEKVVSSPLRSSLLSTSGCTLDELSTGGNEDWKTKSWGNIGQLKEGFVPSEPVEVPRKFPSKTLEESFENVKPYYISPYLNLDESDGDYLSRIPLEGSLGKQGIRMRGGRSQSQSSHGFNYYCIEEDVTPGSLRSSGHMALGDAVKGMSGYPMPWNDEFQSILDLPDDTEDERVVKYTNLSTLAKDYQRTAKQIGKIIISEIGLPIERKTIQPYDLGGQAGGEKYLHHGIVYKFAKDWRGIYGGKHEAAMKAAGHELKGAIRYYICEGIKVPLIILIDYRGWRLVAETVLPVDNSTLRYGSSDGGYTIVNSDLALNRLMENAARKLNIKGHWCGNDNPRAGPVVREKVFLHAPTDIEGHLGKDGRYYVLDMARAFPPTIEGDRGRTHLYQLFRPEFMNLYRYPLSPDACSLFGGRDNKEVHNQEVAQATQHLLEKTIPLFARWLDRRYTSDTNKISALHDIARDITELLHRNGINCRYLGRIRHHIKEPALKQLLLVEMVARIFKNQIRMRLRSESECVRPEQCMAQGRFADVVLRFLNDALSYSDANGEEAPGSYWRHEIKQLLISKFALCLSVEELHSDFSLLYDAGMSSQLSGIFARMGELTGIKLSARTLNSLKKDPQGFQLYPPDIEKMSAKVKHMNVVSLAQGKVLFALADTHSDEHVRERLFTMAMAKFTEAIKSAPDNRSIQMTIAHSHYLRASKKIPEERYKLLSESFKTYVIDFDIEGILKVAALAHQTAGHVSRDKEKVLRLAAQCYEALLGRMEENNELDASMVMGEDNYGDPTWVWAYCTVHYARTMIGIYQVSKNLKMYHKAGRRLLEITENDTVADIGCHLQLSKRLAKFNADDNTLYEFIALLYELSGEELFTTVQTVDIKRVSEVRLLSPTIISMLTAVYDGPVGTTPVHLHHLDLTGLRRVEEELILALVEAGGRHLRAIHLARCENVSDNTLIRLADHCVELTTIDISFCGVSDQGVERLVASCTGLTKLTMRHCDGITPSSINSLSFLVGLVELDISHCAQLCTSIELTQKLWLKPMRILVDKLRVLKMDGLVLPSRKLIGSAIGKGCQLEHFSFSHPVILTRNPKRRKKKGEEGDTGDVWLDKLNTTGRLRYLDLGGMRVSGNGLIRTLLRNPLITTIKLPFTPNIDDQVLSEILTHCSHLETLNLDGSALNLTLLPVLRKLTHLSLRMCPSLPLAIAQWQGRDQFAKLLHLNVSGCNLTGDSLLQLIACCPAVESLNISQNPSIVDPILPSSLPSTLPTTFLRLPHLRHLHLSQLGTLTDHHLQALASTCHFLEVLYLDESIYVYDVGVLAHGCPYLQTLSLAGCHHASHNGVLAVLRLKELVYLNIFGCRYVRDEAIHVIRAQQTLHKLIVGGNKITDNAVQLIRMTPEIEVIVEKYTVNVEPAKKPRKRAHSRNVFYAH